MLVCEQRISNKQKYFQNNTTKTFSYRKIQVYVFFAFCYWFGLSNGSLPAVETNSPSSYQPPPHIRNQKLAENRGKDVLKYMNLQADPCFDFYEYACGDWDRYHPVHPPLNESLTQEILLQHFIEKELQNILEVELGPQIELNTQRYLKDFYKSCMVANRNGVIQQTFFSEFIKAYRGFPAVPASLTKWEELNHNYNWQDMVAKLRHDYAMDILIGIEVNPNPASKQDSVLFFGEPSTLIPTELCSAEGTERVKIDDYKIFDNIQSEVTENLKAWLTLDHSTALRVAANIVRFEFKLCEGMQINSTVDPLEEFGSYRTLKELSHALSNRINFQEIVDTAFGRKVPKKAYMKSMPYYQHMANVVGDNNATTLANYIMYRALSMLAIPDSANTKRPKYCIDIMKRYLPDLLGDLYVQRNLGTIQLASEDFTDIYANLRYSMEKSLGREWIETQTTNLAKTKLKDIQLHLFTSNRNIMEINNITQNYWLNLALVMSQKQQDEIQRFSLITGLQSSQEKNAAFETIVKYRPNGKRIDVCPALLQEPFYNGLYPYSMRYGILGQMIGRELASAFNELQWTSPYLGAVYWNARTEHEYKTRIECFRKQISYYLYNESNTYHNKSLVRELIASASGLNLAFDAYQYWLTYKDPTNDNAQLSKETLPDLNFSNTQLFFVVFAQQYCVSDPTLNGTARTNSETKPILSLLHRHTIQRYMVNGPLQNSADFALDFGCPLGSQMNPADKCVIY